MEHKRKNQAKLRNPSSSGAVDEEMKSSKFDSVLMNIPRYSDNQSLDDVSQGSAK